MNEQLTFGSLFAGIGGFDLGFERAGMVCKWQVEIDDFCNKVLAKHWPAVTRYRDVRECGQHNLEPVDVICGGFPCQPHSLAGERKATSDERELWSEYARIIGEINPRWVVAENVPAILTSETGQYFGGVLKDLAQVGYDAEWHNIPAAQFGAPHKRSRLFIIAYPKGFRWAQQYDGVYKNFKSQSSIKSDITFWECQSSEIIPDLGRAYLSLPDISSMGNGFSNGLVEQSLKALGNAVVPQVAEFIGSAIVEAHTRQLPLEG